MLKYCALFSLCASVSLSADFLTGQAARLVIGQASFTDQLPGASNILLGGVGGVAFANGTLFVADANREGLLPINNRVLLFDTTGFPKPLDPIPAFQPGCPVCVGQAGVVLGQPDFITTNFTTSQTGMRLPTAVATDGIRLVVADTGNNRILIWNSIPTTIDQPADLELGQVDFNSVKTGDAFVVDAKSFRAPQGVWIQDGRLFVADTQNHRVLIWNTFPTQNSQAADIVLGQANFNVAVDANLLVSTTDAHSNTLLNPVSVTSDGTHLFVADLGNNRVLIWNKIPTVNQQPADVVVGQKDMDTAISNDSPDLCVSTGTDTSGNPVYPAICGKTMDFPRFALSDGTRLFIADGGNDRILIYNTIPTANAAAPDAILGQPDEFSSVVTSFTDLFHPLLNQSAANITPTPTGLAWDGTNLYVPDSANRRVLVFTPEEPLVPINGMKNAASMVVFALGSFTVTGTITAGDVLTGIINGTSYSYTVLASDTLDTVMMGLANAINAGTGDPFVTATFEPVLETIKLQARVDGTDGNNITLGVSGSSTPTPTETLAASGDTMQGGGNAAVLAAGTLVAMFGNNIADAVAAADTSQTALPLDLGGVEFYCNGIKSPLLYVSPTQVNGQIPYEILDSNNISCYLRIVRSDGSVHASSALGVPIDIANPGLFAFFDAEPRTAIAFHSTSFASGTITVDGDIQAGDIGTINIGDRSYSYTVQPSDDLGTVRDALVALINANPEERVTAVAGAAFHRLQLHAKVAGPEGDGITFSASVSQGPNVNGALLQLVNLEAQTCCANVAGAMVTVDNPAVPGETITLFGAGLGNITPAAAAVAVVDGVKYNGPLLNDPVSFVSSLAGGFTANVISAALMEGAVGVYQVMLELSPSTPTGTGFNSQLTISQDIYTSNIVTVPVLNPASAPAP